jgi:hypothetical protein
VAAGCDAIEAMRRRQLLLHVALHVGHMHMLHLRIVRACSCWQPNS